jgi:phthiodiolone/phenolphthiodiolone dimycocerosates ketoreductase
MRIGIHLYTHAPLESIRWMVLAARLGGFDSLTVWDHYQHFIPQQLWTTDFTWMAGYVDSPHETFDSWTLLGALARQVGRMRAGVLVTAPSRRHPVALAQAALTLAHLTRRAPILGLGVGDRHSSVPYGVEVAKPVSQLDEALQIIRHCFSSRGTVDFSGEHYQLKGAVLDLAPPAGRTPEIWVGAHGARMLRLTGTYADGWVPHIVFPDEYAEKLAIVRQAAKEAGRDPAAITPSNEMLAVVARTERDARAMLDTLIGRYSALLMPAAAWRSFGLEHPLGRDFGGFTEIIPEEYKAEVLQDAIRQVPVEIIGEFMLWGTPSQVASRLRQFEEAGMEHAALVPGAAYVSRRAALWNIAGLRSVRGQMG